MYRGLDYKRGRLCYPIAASLIKTRRMIRRGGFVSKRIIKAMLSMKNGMRVTSKRLKKS